MKLHHLPIAILFISMIILGCTFYIADLQDKYGVTADMSALNNTQIRLESQRRTANETYTAIEDFITDASSPSGLLDIPYDMLKIAWSSTKTLLSSIGMIQSIISDLNKGLSQAGIPLPSWLLPTIISVFVIIMIAIVVYAFFKWKFED